MRYDEKQHPDDLDARNSFKKIERGGNQAVEDKAIDAYIAAYNAGNPQEAERVFFQLHRDARK